MLLFYALFMPSSLMFASSPAASMQAQDRIQYLSPSPVSMERIAIRDISLVGEWTLYVIFFISGAFFAVKWFLSYKNTRRLTHAHAVKRNHGAPVNKRAVNKKSLRSLEEASKSANEKRETLQSMAVCGLALLLLSGVGSYMRITTFTSVEIRINENEATLILYYEHTCREKHINIDDISEFIIQESSFVGRTGRSGKTYILHIKTNNGNIFRSTGVGNSAIPVKIISHCGLFSGPPTKACKTTFGWKAYYVPLPRPSVRKADASGKTE
jgi:hypothetical protein